MNSHVVYSHVTYRHVTYSQVKQKADVILCVFAFGYVCHVYVYIVCYNIVIKINLTLNVSVCFSFFDCVLFVFAYILDKGIIFHLIKTFLWLKQAAYY